MDYKDKFLAHRCCHTIATHRLKATVRVKRATHFSGVVLRRRPGRGQLPFGGLCRTSHPVTSLAYAHDVGAVEVVQHDATVVVDEQLLRFQVDMNGTGDFVQGLQGIAGIAGIAGEPFSHACIILENGQWAEHSHQYVKLPPFLKLGAMLGGRSVGSVQTARCFVCWVEFSSVDLCDLQEQQVTQQVVTCSPLAASSAMETTARSGSSIFPRKIARRKLVV